MKMTNKILKKLPLMKNQPLLVLPLQSTGEIQALLLPWETKDLATVAMLSQQLPPWKVSTKSRRDSSILSQPNKSLIAQPVSETRLAVVASWPTPSTTWNQTSLWKSPLIHTLEDTEAADTVPQAVLSTLSVIPLLPEPTMLCWMLSLNNQSPLELAWTLHISWTTRAESLPPLDVEPQCNMPSSLSDMVSHHSETHSGSPRTLGEPVGEKTDTSEFSDNQASMELVYAVFSTWHPSLTSEIKVIENELSKFGFIIC